MTTSRRHNNLLKLWLTLLVLFPQYSISESLPKYHPLKEDRVAIERSNAAPQMSYNVNKKFEGVADRFGNSDLEGAMNSLKAMLEWNLSKYERAVVHQFMGFIYVQQNDVDSAIKAFKTCIDYNALSNSQHQGTVFNLASLYGSQEKWELAIDSLMQFYKFEQDPAAESYIMAGIAYFQKGQPLKALPYIH